MATMSSSINDDMASQNPEHINFVAQNLIMKANISMALNAVLKLGIPDILATADGGKPLSAEEILRQLPTKSTPGPTYVRNLQRLLSPLVREGLFSESVDGNEQPMYSLTEVSKWFIRESQLSIAPVADMAFNPRRASTRQYLHEVILDDTTTASVKAHGVHPYEYNKDPAYVSLIQNAMEANSKMFFKGVLESLLQSSALDGVGTLVDVGGGWGHIVAQIVAHNPHIHGINFDLPFVIDKAPAVNGVKHVAGSFFESVPSGDAMFLKWIIHNYADEEAIHILKKHSRQRMGSVTLIEGFKE
ncbi:unnamed protein product [Calypogeia fissa]